MFRTLLLRLACLLLAAWAGPAAADVHVAFHSFSGSFLTGRYPHAFVAFDGTLANGERVHSNYGFSARNVGPAILRGPVAHGMYTEKEKYLRSTNRHFMLTVDDATYRRMMQEMAAWRDAPGLYYDLNRRNCIHFVGAIAEIGGLRVDYPRDMLRHPKEWLNHVSALNPQLGARPIR